mgnify:CR=1 FL=1
MAPIDIPTSLENLKLERDAIVLYDSLAEIAPSPVVRLNQAVAVSMASGPSAGLEMVDRLVAERLDERGGGEERGAVSVIVAVALVALLVVLSVFLAACLVAVRWCLRPVRDLVPVIANVGPQNLGHRLRPGAGS